MRTIQSTLNSMRAHKEHCVSHIVTMFEERFTEKDFTTESKKWGEVVWKEEVVNAIVNAPQMGTLVKGGKGDCVIYKVKIMNTKSVFVIWNMLLNCAVTVLTGEMYTTTQNGELSRFYKWDQ